MAVTVRVFAYGSNLHVEELARWMAVNGFAPLALERVLLGSLPDHRLVWDYPSQSRPGGAANVEPCEGEEVPGAVLEVDEPALDALDAKEGYPERYGRAELVVRLADGGETTAWVYRVTRAWRQPHPVWPSELYLATVLEGGRRLGLPDAYLRALAATPTFVPT